jgi:hypothetical protein
MRFLVHIVDSQPRRRSILAKATPFFNEPPALRQEQRQNADAKVGTLLHKSKDLPQKKQFSGTPIYNKEHEKIRHTLRRAFNPITHKGFPLTSHGQSIFMD